jgi:hypothetical protein
MTVDTQELREAIASLKAEAGIDKWFDLSDDLYENSADYKISSVPETDFRYIVAASPAKVSALLDEIDRLRAELQPRRWQVIETAPKDGRTLLLGYFNSHGKWRTVRGQWMSEDYIAEYWEDLDDIEPGWFETSVEADDAPNCWRIEPTHWMPIPPGPRLEKMQ